MGTSQERAWNRLTAFPSFTISRRPHSRASEDQSHVPFPIRIPLTLNHLLHAFPESGPPACYYAV